MSEESIIGTDGSLKLSNNEVTWFSFLQLSRSTNSEQKGWNSKSHWSKRGLDQLVSASGGFVAAWTKNSLDSKTLPKPREGKFQFEDRLKALEKGERGFAGTPKEKAENGINWGLSQSLRTRSRIFAYEVPLAKEQKGQLKADVVVFHVGGRIEIIELKCSGKKSPDTPLMALTEAICYAIQTTRCWEHMAKEAEAHLGGKSLDKLTEIHLVLAAPDYWNNCNPGRGEKRRINPEQVSKLVAITDAVGAELGGVNLNLSLADIAETGGDLKVIKESPQPPRWSILAPENQAHSTR